MQEKVYKEKTQSVLNGYPTDNIDVLLCAYMCLYVLLFSDAEDNKAVPFAMVPLGAICSLGSLGRLGSERVERVDGHWVHRGIPEDLR